MTHTTARTLIFAIGLLFLAIILNSCDTTHCHQYWKLKQQEYSKYPSRRN